MYISFCEAESFNVLGTKSFTYAATVLSAYVLKFVLAFLREQINEFGKLWKAKCWFESHFAKILRAVSIVL